MIQIWPCLFLLQFFDRVNPMVAINSKEGAERGPYIQY